jgi:HTH-type transcriptional regulator, sugar sensing transcriptional regulator
MRDGFVPELEQLGLSTAEAQLYVVLIENGSLSAAGAANLAGIQRSNVYPILLSLTNKGLVEGGAGYGSKFTAVPPEHALPALIVREREDLEHKEGLANELSQRMAPLVASSEATPEELIQVLRSPKVIAERFDRLQLEARRRIDIIIKAPILNPRGDNPSQAKALKRGVVVRGLYERVAVEDPGVAPYLDGWIAGGEVMRVYDGELPHKLVIFDTEVALLPLSMPGTQMRALVIKHEQLAQSLTIMFETFWGQAEPISRRSARKKRARPKSRNGRELVRANSNNQPMAANN